jgi:CheY-like chemotaxis protein
MNSLSTLYPFDILIVEDNFINQTLIRKLFDVLGYKTDLVVNGVEALKAVELKKYHLVFMDIQMPEMDGYEASKLIVERMGADAPVIIALTASATLGDKGKCMLYGMSDYLSKPLLLPSLSKMLSHWGELKKEWFIKPIDN